MQKHLQCTAWPSKIEIKPGSKCMKRSETTRCDIRMWPSPSILNA